jgi:hypothetical protein
MRALRLVKATDHLIVIQQRSNYVLAANQRQFFAGSGTSPNVKIDATWRLDTSIASAP